MSESPGSPPETLAAPPSQDRAPVHPQVERESMLQESANGTAEPVEGSADDGVQHSSQRESYHSTNQPLVTERPSEERATLSGEDRRDEDFEGGSVLEELERFSASVGPVKFQEWQSTFYRLLREGFVDTEAIPGEEKSSFGKTDEGKL